MGGAAATLPVAASADSTAAVVTTFQEWNEDPRQGWLIIIIKRAGSLNQFLD